MIVITAPVRALHKFRRVVERHAQFAVLELFVLPQAKVVRGIVEVLHRLIIDRASLFGGAPALQPRRFLQALRLAHEFFQRLPLAGFEPGINRNRFVGARHDDPVPGRPKVEIAARLVREIDPAIAVTPVRASLVSEEAFAAVRQADWVFGCFDDDGPRAILNELCAAYAKPYVDLASDVPEAGVYGGRVCVAWDGGGCLHCLDALDPRDVEAYLSTDAEQAGRAAIYGVPVEALGEAGPSVSPINGVVAALAAAEFMVAVTGMREPQRLINYYGQVPRLTTAKPKPDCYYCKGIRGKPDDADAERFLRMPHLRERRRQSMTR